MKDPAHPRQSEHQLRQGAKQERGAEREVRDEAADRDHDHDDVTTLGKKDRRVRPDSQSVT